jgi:polyphosphate glucokinase
VAIVGVDVGGSGIKAAPVDPVAGRPTVERFRLATPQPAEVEPVMKAILDVIEHFSDVDGPVGVTFPGVVVHNEIRTAANVDKSWIGVDLAALVTHRTGRPTLVLNDADAAGLAEVHHGAAKGVTGVVLLLTFGTGVGSALFIDGQLVPNTELGHLEWKGEDAEKRVATSVREAKDWGWEKWGHRASEYLALIDTLFSPDLVVIGGGLANNPERWIGHIEARMRCVPAALANQAGIVGAATAAAGLLG